MDGDGRTKWAVAVRRLTEAADTMPLAPEPAPKPKRARPYDDLTAFVTIMRAKGYTLRQAADLAAEFGIPVSAATLSWLGKRGKA